MLFSVPELIAIGTAVLLLGLVVYRWKRYFVKNDVRNLGIGLIVLFSVYLLLVSVAIYADWSTHAELAAFDLNGDGVFSDAEHASMALAMSGIVRVFAFVLGFPVAVIIALLVSVLHWLMVLVTKRSTKRFNL